MLREKGKAAVIHPIGTGKISSGTDSFVNED